MTPRRIIVLVLATLIASAANARERRAVPSDGPILFFGDSITEGWMDAVRCPAYAFPAVCDSLLRSGGIRRPTENLGSAGETTEDALRRIGSDVLSRNPAVVVIAFGSNDWYVHGFATAPRVPLARFEENLRLIVWKLQGLGIAPILLGLPPVLPVRYYRYSPERLYAPFGGVAAHRAAYNDAVVRVASLTHVPCVPIALDTAENSSLLGMDGLHPTADAHRMIAAALREPIEEALLKGGAQPGSVRDLDLFPQPLRAEAHSRMFLRFAAARPGNVRLRILDASGRELRNVACAVAAAGTQYVALDIADAFGVPLPCGVYVLVLEDSDMRLDQKFIIQ